MASTYELSYSGGLLTGSIALTGSKSIANRALLIRALTPGGFAIHGLAAADDTVRLQRLLESDEEVLDCGPAGTTYRFLTGYLCRRQGTQLLTGSERMKERPIGILVDALRGLGADIEYAEKEGYPPLRIGYSALDKTDRIGIAADTSSQYISSLLMLAPTLPTGLKLTLEGDIVSLPYIKMTLALMAHFGVHHQLGRTDHRGRPPVLPGPGLHRRGRLVGGQLLLQPGGPRAGGGPPDRRPVRRQPAGRRGRAATLRPSSGSPRPSTTTGLRMTKPAGFAPPALFEHNFVECPDIAQTLMATCAEHSGYRDFTPACRRSSSRRPTG